MIELILLACLIAATFFDLKGREIPPALTYSMIVFGAIWSFILFPTNLSDKFISAAASIAAGFLLYKLGVWAGGDFKLFAGISLMMPLFATDNAMFFPLYFLAFAVIFFVPFIFIYLLAVARKNKNIFFLVSESFKKNNFDIIINANFAVILLYFVEAVKIPYPLDWILGFVLFALLIWQKKYLKYLSFVVILVFFRDSNFLFVYIPLTAVVFFYQKGIETFGIMRRHVLTEKVNIRNLKEGMIPAEDYWLEKGKIKHEQPKLFSPFKKVKINSRLARGLTEDEIKFLKKYKIKEIQVKKSTPFVPLLLFTYIILLIMSKFLK